MRILCRRTALALAVSILLLVGLLGGVALAAYPTPAPDFAHPDSPHKARYSPASGGTSRPLLVIYRTFSNIDVPGQMQHGSYGWVKSTIFGPGYPSVVDWYDEVSFGRFNFYAAEETYLDHDDGMVYVTAGTKEEYDAMALGERGKTALEAADPYVDFSSFDANRDGRLTPDELTVVQAFVEPYENFDGGARWIDPVVLDGVQLSTLEQMAYMPHTWSFQAFVHEIMHVAFGARDTYGFGAGSLDTMGGLGTPSAWHRLHLGWSVPTVVTRDGYYTVWDAASTGISYVLYDYERGTDDYFLVENRRRTTGWYDDSISDSGLVIWRVDEAVYESESGEVRPIEPMRPDGTTTPACWKEIRDGETVPLCYGGRDIDAWDPSDANTPQRTLERPWRDGTPSGVAVRAISASDYAMKVYFDVRGPGVMVDASDASGRVAQLVAYPGQTVVVPFTAMNTGEAAGTFLLEMSTLPQGWHAGFRYEVLAAGEQMAASLSVQVPTSTAEGTYLLRVHGQSAGDASVDSVSEIEVKVTDHVTDIEYDGPDSAPLGTEVALWAEVTDRDSGEDWGVAGWPVDDVPVTFTISGAGGTREGSATTNINGIALFRPTLDLPAGEYSVTVSTPRSGIHAPATTTGRITLFKHEVEILFQGAYHVYSGSTAHLWAILRDLSLPAGSATGPPRVRAGVPVTFVLGEGPEASIVSGVTDWSGAVAVDMQVDLPPGSYPVSVISSPTEEYSSAWASSDFTVYAHATGIAYTGGLSGMWGEPADFVAELSDLSVAGSSMEGLAVDFDLVDSDGVLLRSVSTSDASGVAVSAPIIDLPPGDYGLRVSTPGDAVHRPASVMTSFSVLRRPVTITYSGDVAADYSDEAMLRAELKDAATGEPISGCEVVFTLGPSSLTAITDADGVAATSMAVGLGAGSYTLGVEFGGDDRYEASASAYQGFLVQRESLTLQYVGETYAEIGRAVTLAVQAEQAADGSSGDLSLAEAQIELVPLLGGATLTYRLALDAAGSGVLTLADGLDVDAYSIRLTVPSDNLFWQSQSLEVRDGLIVCDPSRRLIAGLAGVDAAGGGVRLAGVAGFDSGLLSVQMRGTVPGGRLISGEAEWLVISGDTAALRFQAWIGDVQHTATLLLLVDDASGEQTICLRLEREGAVVYDSGAIGVKSGVLAIK